MEIFYQILEVINYFFIALASLGFLFQLFFILFGRLKPRKYRKAKVQHKIAILIPAYQEGDVIENSVKRILEKQTYPKELYDVIVCAHNCTDNTYELAKNAGAIVCELNDPDPTHKKKGYPVSMCVDIAIKSEKGYDAVICLDADNILKDDFIEKMNDALDSGVKIGRGFEYSSNIAQNNWTKVSGTYYIRDSRIASNFRETFGLDVMLCGPGMLISIDVLKDIGGWDAFSASEDVEFTMNRMIEKRRIHYVPDAIIYEDQPSTFKDTFNRLTRMGNGLNGLFWKKGFKFVSRFFVTGRISYLDLFMQVAFIPISLICCVWFPAYYIFYCIVHLINAFGPAVFVASFITSEQSLAMIIELAWMVLYVLVSYYLIYTFQTWLACITSKKHLGLKSLKGMWAGILLSAGFMIIYAIAITIGICSKPQWKKINRNKVTEIDTSAIN